MLQCVYGNDHMKMDTTGHFLWGGGGGLRSGSAHKAQDHVFLGGVGAGDLQESESNNVGDCGRDGSSQVVAPK